MKFLHTLSLFCAVSALLVFTTTNSRADTPRPWDKSPATFTTPATQVRFADGALYLLGDSLQQSFDFGKTWTTITTVKGRVIGIAPFIGDGAIVITQQADGAPVIGYYSLIGTNWEPFDSIPTSSKAVAVYTQGLNAYTAMENGTIYVRNTQLDSIKIPGVTLRDIVATATTMVVATNTGTLISTNNGAEFSPLVFQYQGNALPVFPITVLENTIYGCTPKGAVVLNENNTSWEPVGVWEKGPLAVEDIDIAAGNLYVLSNFTPEGSTNSRRQLYRFGTTDTLWTAIGDTLPGAPYTTNASPMAFDATRAVLSHAVPSVDSLSGVYVYDVNDFTSVQEAVLPSTEMPDWNGTVIVRVYDVMGRELYTTSIEGITTPLQLPQNVAGIIALTYTNSEGNIWRTMKVR